MALSLAGINVIGLMDQSRTARVLSELSNLDVDKVAVEGGIA